MKSISTLLGLTIISVNAFAQLYLPGGTSGINDNLQSANLEYKASGMWNGTIRANGSGYTSFAIWQDGALRWAMYNHPTVNNTLLFANSAGEDKVSITQDGRLGIGTIVPVKSLHVSGTGDVEQWIEAKDNGFASLTLVSNNNRWQWSKRPGHELDALQLYYNNGTSWSAPYMTVLPNGNVGIGSNPYAKLSVKGSIHCEEVKVDLSVPAPDYVFEEDYYLRSLAEVKAYIQENKHLPDIPGGKELETSGLYLGEMNMLLLKKIEEMTLHMIQMEERLIEQERVIQQFQDLLQAESR